MSINSTVSVLPVPLHGRIVDQTVMMHTVPNDPLTFLGTETGKSSTRIRARFVHHRACA
jgi:hypothetical protein